MSWGKYRVRVAVGGGIRDGKSEIGKPILSDPRVSPATGSADPRQSCFHQKVGTESTHRVLKKCCAFCSVATQCIITVGASRTVYVTDAPDPRCSRCVAGSAHGLVVGRRA